MATDIITTELLSNGTEDYDTVNTIGAAPASMTLTAAGDSTLAVSDGSLEIAVYFRLVDEYGNPSVHADFYGHEVYEVAFAVSEGGGSFDIDTADVETLNGEGGTDYNSSTVAGVYTITATATSGDAEATVDITQIPGDPDSLVLAPDSVAIAAGTGIELSAELFDMYSNHINIPSAGWVIATTDYGLHDEGSISSFGLNAENGTVRIVYRSDPYQADTAHVYVSLNLPEIRSQYQDTVVVFSAEPGNFDHFVINSVFTDTLDVPEFQWIEMEAQDVNNIHLYTYNNLDTITLTLDESSADTSQVTWIIGADTTIGLTAFIPDSSFENGYSNFHISNKKAETVTITATDTAGHTGTSPELTWLPIEVVGFTVGLEDGATEMQTGVETNVEVTAIDEFGNATAVGLPRNIVLSANQTGVITFPTGSTQLMQTATALYPTMAEAEADGLIITVADINQPLINGSSYEITVTAGGIEEGIPAVSRVSAKFGSGDVLCEVAEAGEVTVKVYNKVGMEVGTLLSGNVGPGYYQLSLKELNLASDVYFVVMNVAGQQKQAKVGLIR